MKPEVTERDITEELRTLVHHLHHMKRLQKKGLYKACNLKLFNQHLLHATIEAETLYEERIRPHMEQPPLFGKKK